MSTTGLAITSLIALVAAETGARHRPASGTWWGPPAPDALPGMGPAATLHHGATRGLRAAAAVAFLGAVATEMVALPRASLVGAVAWTVVVVLLAMALRDGLRALRDASNLGVGPRTGWVGSDPARPAAAPPASDALHRPVRCRTEPRPSARRHRHRAGRPHRT